MMTVVSPESWTLTHNFPAAQPIRQESGLGDVVTLNDP